MKVRRNRAENEMRSKLIETKIDRFPVFFPPLEIKVTNKRVARNNRFRQRFVCRVRVLLKYLYKAQIHFSSFAGMARTNISLGVHDSPQQSGSQTTNYRQQTTDNRQTTSDSHNIAWQLQQA
ncbi:unnamed protein product [Ceratitis capitata]|uniref:(Mediterranean fruit fly) hypothetical protein n=1 Tax=Ceratitis capitata TaxID=7213 RepID=A0A811V1D5_CERCA|nr:unnamed protein product [Ceratitis capitata]